MRFCCLALSLLGACVPISERTSLESKRFSDADCCPRFKELIQPYLSGFPEDAGNAPLEEQINWIAEHSAEGAAKLGHFAKIQIEEHSQNFKNGAVQPHEEYDVVIVGGGYLSSMLSCNLVAPSESTESHPSETVADGCKNTDTHAIRKLVVSETIGGPFFAFGKTFFLNTREYPDAKVSEHLFYGCPIQVEPFLHHVDKKFNPEDGGYYPEADVLGKVAVINLMLSGGHFAVDATPSKTLEVEEGRYQLSLEALQTSTWKQEVLTPHVALILGSGKGRLLPVEAVESSNLSEGPLQQTIETFLTEAADSTTRQPPVPLSPEHRVGIVGHGNGALAALQYLLGNAPQSAYMPGHIRGQPLLRSSIQLYGPEDISTKSLFLQKLKGYQHLKFLNREVGDAIETGKVATTMMRADGVQVITTAQGRKLAVSASGTSRCIPSQPQHCLDRVVVATGYDIQRDNPIPERILRLQPRYAEASDFKLPTYADHIDHVAGTDTIAKISRHNHPQASSSGTTQPSPAVYRIVWRELFKPSAQESPPGVARISTGQQLGPRLMALGQYLRDQSSLRR